MTTRQLNFVPTDFSGCVLWLRADQGLSVDEVGKVIQWGDMSGQGNHLTQAIVAKRPDGPTSKRPNFTPTTLANRQTVQFDGTDDFLQKAFTLAQPFTHFLVYRQNAFTATSGQDIPFDGATFPNAVMTCSTTTLHRWSMFAGGSEPNYDVMVANGVYAVICDQWNGASSFGRVNGVQVMSGNPGTASPNGITLGASGSGTRACAINVAELVVFNRTLTQTEINAIELYLFSRYQISLS